jgi:serine/threonine protein kinase/Tol biopolymer transport system component
LNRDHWQKIEDLFHAALGRDSTDRSEFLTNIEDQFLRQEVASLISAFELSGEFLEENQLNAGLDLYSADDSRSLVGQVIGHYSLEGRLGRGGMGDVYLARDDRLGRKVALKVLPLFLSNDADWVARFHQEARAASAISHPNIAHIYEVGNFEEQQYIAMEYIEGNTLRQLMKRGRIDLEETIRIALQVAQGIAAAHAAGIVHRDIKPENIMVRPDGYVKVLDFGLAMTMHIESRYADREILDDIKQAEQGTICGTARYMSPEQALGLQSDPRTDIWSLGVILYELWCGGPPFTGPTNGDVLSEILKAEPPELFDEYSSLSPAAKAILRRALCKDREVRYQSASELIQHLRNLREHGLSKVKIISHDRTDDQRERFSETSTAVRGPYHSTDENSVAATSEKRLLTESAIPEVLLTTKEPRVITKHRTLEILAVFSLISIVLGVGIYQLRGHPTTPPTLSKTMKVTKVSNGGAWAPSISPDGKYVAYVANDVAGQMAIWIKLVATGQAYELVAPAGLNYGGLVFTRDGNYLYYLTQDMNNMSEYYQGDYYRIPIGGGASRKIVSNAGGATFSSDGKQMAFIRAVPSRQVHDLIICTDDGTNERVIATRHWPEISWLPTWSPDGRFIAFGARNQDGDGFYNTVMSVPVDGGPEVPVTSYRWLDVGWQVWLGDGTGLMVTGHEQLTDPMQIYFVAYPRGEVTRVTNDTSSYSTLQITADARTLVAEMADVTANIWVAAGGNASGARQITTGGRDGLGGLSWTPDGKIVYASVSRDHFNNVGANSNRAIWVVNSDGSNPRQLTVNGFDMNPAVTPDGREIVFASLRNGGWGIWRSEMEGSNSVLLASGGTTTFPICSPDGRWIYFRRLSSASPPSIWRVPTGGGEPVQISRDYAYYPAVSPDGNWVAFFSPSEKRTRLLVIPSTGGEVVKTFNVAPETDYLIFSEIVRWTSDGRYLTYIKNQGVTSNIWGQPLDGGAPRQLTNFEAERIFSFAWSADNQLAVARGQYNRQIVLLRDFR